jgi:mRNA interferase RelE/StbE
MAYKIVITDPAKKDIRRLDPLIQQRAVTAIRSLGETPRPVGYKQLKGEAAFRISFSKDYRVVYDIDDAAQVITILKVRHRSYVYKRR